MPLGVTVADPTPPGLTFVSNAGDCTTVFPCNLGALPAGATRTITATFAVPSGYTTPNPIANTATVSSPTPPVVSTSATTNTPVGAPVTDLHITNTNGVNGVVAGLPTTYTITVTNPLGPSDASGATVTDVFPTTLTGVTWTCTGTGGGACPDVGQRRHQHVRDRAGGRDASSSPPPARSIPRPPASSSTRPRCSRPRDSPTARRRSPPTATPSPRAPTWRITKTGPASDRRGQLARLHDHGHQHRAVGRRGRGGERCRRRPAWCSCRTRATARRPSRARSASCRPAPRARSPRPSACRSRIPAWARS